MKVIKNKVCRMFSSTKFDLVINLWKHPLVNILISKKDIKKKDPTFSIKVLQCKSCKLVQIKDVIDAEEIYKKVDYLYFSSDMHKLDKFFKPSRGKPTNYEEYLSLQIGKYYHMNQ